MQQRYPGYEWEYQRKGNKTFETYDNMPQQMHYSSSNTNSAQDIQNPNFGAKYYDQ